MLEGFQIIRLRPSILKDLFYLSGIDADPPSSRFYLIMIAQEEFAKAFILFLVRENIAPFSSAVLRAIRDHSCKQLVGMIMDYMIMHWEEYEELEAAVKRDVELGDRLPNDVGSAIELLRYEKIGRWEANNWSWAEDPEYDTEALQIARGKKDRRKQDALYVRIGRDGQVCNTPNTVSEAETQEEFERASRFGRFIREILCGQHSTYRYEKAISALQTLFEHQLSNRQ
ncbi:hypothetical protein So717_17290 [Roseobacter cerasinus]|uniref:Uncharacterized protein n=1 Tax=Roseobacter cerasinus TaxID=2602289 RepID=A0A640VUS3_9RHOB|nr:hypothetical protein [Roseobacter cerasinus]GFE49976.1 hypothetical protein So717_17290 [Roseobacter cerasinus]